jgi:hypothetical protein
MVDAGVKVAAVAQHLSEEPQLERRALELASEACFRQAGLVPGYRNQLVRRRIQGTGHCIQQHSAFVGAQGGEWRGGRLGRGDQ